MYVLETVYFNLKYWLFFGMEIFSDALVVRKFVTQILLVVMVRTVMLVRNLFHMKYFQPNLRE